MGRLSHIFWRGVRFLTFGVYWALTRLLLTTIFLFCLVFFVLNARPFPTALSELLKSALPGTLTFGGLQVSPIPWRVVLMDVHIATPDGTEVVRADSIRVAMDLRPLVSFVLGDSNDRLDLRFRSIDMRGYWASLVFDDQGQFKFLDAFVFVPDPHPAPATGKGLDVRLAFSQIRGQDGSVFLGFPEWDIDLDGVSVDVSLRVDSNGVVVKAPDVTFANGLGRIHAAPDLQVLPRQITMGPGQVRGFTFDTDYIEFVSVRIPAVGLDLAASGRLTFTPDLPLSYDGAASITFPAGSALLGTVSSGLTCGPLTLHVQGFGDYTNPRFRLIAASPKLTLGGITLSHLELGVSGARALDGAYVLSDIALAADSPFGQVRLADGEVLPFGPAKGDGAMEATAKLKLADVDIEPLLQHFEVASLPRLVPMPKLLQGEVDVAARIGGAGQASRIRITSSLAGALKPGSVMAGRDLSLRLAASATVISDWAHPVVAIENLSARSGEDQIHLSGTVDLHQQTLALLGHVDKDLGSLMSALGSTGRGLAHVSDIRVSGSPSNPTVTAHLQAEQAAVMDWEVQTLAGEVGFQDGGIRATNIQLATSWGNVAVAGLTLPLTGARGPASHLVIDKIVANGLDLSKVPMLTSLGLRGKANLAVKRVSFSTTNPMPSLSGEGMIEVPALTVAGKTFRQVDIAWFADRGQIRLPRARLDLAGGGQIEASGLMDLVSTKLDASLTVTNVPLATLAGMKPDDLQGTISLSARADGTLSDPGLTAHADLADVAYSGIRATALSLDVDRRPGGNLTVASDPFLPKMSLNPESGLTWKDGAFTGLVLMIDINRLTPQDLLPAMKWRDFSAQLTGNVVMGLSFGPSGTLSLALTAPPGGLIMTFMNRAKTLINEDRTVIAVQPDGSMTVQGLALNDGDRSFTLCGHIMDPSGATRLAAWGDIGMYWLRVLKDVVSSADGYLHVGGRGGPAVSLPVECPANPASADGPMIVTGDIVPPIMAGMPSLSRPVLSGALSFGEIDVTLRKYPDPIHLDAGGRIEIIPTDNQQMRIDIPQAQRLKGTLGEGVFSLFGQASMVGFLPDTGELALSGTGLRFTSPGQFYVVANPELKLTFAQLSATGAEKLTLAGRIAVIEGSYHQNFDVVRKAFSGVTGGRVAERSSPSVTETIPMLNRLALDLAVTGSRFGVRTQLPFGSTDMDIGLDLAVKGTLGNLELWNRVEVVPGGKVTYNVVRREFEVTRGTIDFAGDPAQPILDVTARTKINYRGAGGSQTSASSRFDPEASDSGFDSDMVVVTLKVSGRFPNVDFSLSSTAKDLDQTDLQYLVLTGMTRQDAAGAGSGSALNLDIGLLTDDMANLVSKLLLSPFVDAVRFGVSASGGINAQVLAHMGSRLKFETQVMQESGGSRYTAGFQVRLTERLSLEGRLRAVEQSIDPSEEGRRYETKLRYRIPLD